MSVRKKGVAEDVRLRPFASETFNAQSFVQSILLSQRQSEEVLPEIETFIQSVNEEISVFIRKNKRDLMRGTEDISLLAAKYTALHQTSQSLLQRASKLRLESTASLQALRAKAEELQRMHSTGVVLRQLRQFVHIKGQLDHQIELCSLSSSNPEQQQQQLNTSEVDIRQLASLARVLHELELLMSLPTLSLIETVVEARPDIESFGVQLRKSAQNILLLSLQEQNQANLSSALQVFYHLESLPEVLSNAVNRTVKLVADLIKEVIDINALVADFPELAPGSKASNTSRIASAPAASKSLGKKDSSSANQLRNAMRDLVHQFENILFEYSAQQFMVQQIVWQQEQEHRSRSTSGLNTSIHSFASLLMASTFFEKHGANTLHFFWDRLSAALEDVFVEKLKVHPHALVRLYPSLRRAAIEVQDAFEQKLAREIAASGITSEPHESRPQLLPASYSFSDIFGCASITVDTSALGYGPRKGAGNGVLHLNKVPPSSLALVHGQSTKESKIHEGKEADPGEKSGLIAGIHCCRDRYLQETAARMAAPILLMFPELDGFTSAVPSKRDLALLLTVIRTELITVLVEGDLSLLRVLSKEVVKVIRLLLVKIEGLLSHHNDVARINIIVNNSSSVSIGGSSSSSPLASGVCSRNAAQELNHQIAVLLFSFMDSLRALPVEALKGAQELQGRGAAAAALQTRSAAANEAFKADSLSEMKAGVEGAVKVLESLLTSSLLLTNVSTISRYVNELLGGILINETTSASATALCFLPAPSYCSSDTTALKLCSRPMRALVAAFPLIIGSHVMNLPADNALTTATAEECCLRLLASVISACSLLRPLSDATKKRLLADLELAELLVGGLQPQLRSAFNETPSKLPVIEELKCFKKLVIGGLGDIVGAVPSSTLLHSTVCAALRPSTLLAHLICLAPPQLPSPLETAGGMTIPSYLQSLMTPPSPLSEVDTEALSKSPFGADSILQAYCSPSDSLPGEVGFWQLVVLSLDVFMQRASVADSATQRKLMRQWYELILDVGAMRKLTSSSTTMSSQTARVVSRQ